MEFTHLRIVRLVAALLVVATITQSVYTALYIAKMEVPQQLLWGAEGLVFSLLAALAGTAMVRSRALTLAFAPIAFAGALNIVQVGVGLTLFGPFEEAANAAPALAPAASAIVAFSFFIYNAAKVMFGLAALVAGLTLTRRGGKLLGWATALAGGIALLANAVKLVSGGDVLDQIPLAGGAGVLATLLLALSLFVLAKED